MPVGDAARIGEDPCLGGRHHADHRPDTQDVMGAGQAGRGRLIQRGQIGREEC
jgi:hypothetical protein